MSRRHFYHGESKPRETSPEVRLLGLKIIFALLAIPFIIGLFKTAI